MKAARSYDGTVTGEAGNPNVQRTNKGVAFEVFSGGNRGLHWTLGVQVCVLEVKKALLKT